MKAPIAFRAARTGSLARGGYHAGFPVSVLYRVQAGEDDTGSVATVPAVTVAAHHASPERDAEPPPPAAAEAGRWPGQAARALLRERC